ncbi:MAG TPA: S8 family serine peptidase [Syntrophorhabdaceae bacterium]|jgi:subtilisin family serine protease
MPRVPFLALSGFIAFITFASLAIPISYSATPSPDDPIAKVRSRGGYAGLLSTAVKRGAVKVIVKVDASLPSEGDKAEAFRSVISGAQDQVLSELKASGKPPLRALKFATIPYMALTVDGPTLESLLSSASVTGIFEDKKARPKLDTSVPRIDANTLHRSQLTGTGIAVAILDTGVDKLHPFLKGSVVSEACYSTNDTSHKATSLCPKKADESTAAGSAMPYGGACPIEECGHGTNVAGIIAGRSGIAGSPGPGVAPGASIIAIQVFSRLESKEDCDDGEAPCVTSYDSDQIQGLERVYALRTTYTIGAVNMSLGGGQYASNCDDDPIKAIIDNLRAAGIATIIASGNEEYCGSTGAPACVSTAVSVGATDEDNTVADYSNSATFLTLLAPGSEITTAFPRQEGGGYETESGTSMAAPHVAGAWALLKQAKPAATVNEILAAFTSTGTEVTDTGKCPSVTKKLINVYQAYQALIGKATLIIGKSGKGSGAVSSSPSGINCGTQCSVVFANGAAITLTAVPASDSTFSGWTGGGCSGTGACNLSLTGKTQVTASFSGPCDYTINPGHKDFPSKGGNVTVNVRATGEDNCPAPGITVDDTWMSASLTSFRKNRGSVKIFTYYNDNPDPRTGTVTIGDEEFSVEQKETTCTMPSVSPMKETFAADEDSAKFTVNQKTDCAWTARVVPPADEWLTVTSGATGSGTGRVSFGVAENTTEDKRSGKIEVSLNLFPNKKRLFTVQQDAP